MTGTITRRACKGAASGSGPPTPALTIRAARPGPPGHEPGPQEVQRCMPAGDNGGSFREDGRMGRGCWSFKRMLALVGAAACALLAACNNSPYVAGAASKNVLFNSFDERSPRYLDPTASYLNPETPYTFS